MDTASPMKWLVWILLTPFLIAFAGVTWLFVSADWSGPRYQAIPVRIQDASISHEMGAWRTSRIETARLQLRYVYEWNGIAYKGWRFSCEKFGGNEIMPRRRTDDLDRVLEVHLHALQTAGPVFAWVDTKRPEHSCLFKDGRFASP